MAKTKKPKTIQVHLDADYLVYQAGFSAQHTSYLLVDDGAAVNEYSKAEDVKAAMATFAKEGRDLSHFVKWERTEVEPSENALHTCKLQINDIVEQVEGKFGLKADLSLYLTGTGNFREKIATIRPYKGNRPPWAKPRLYRELRQYMVDVWGAKVIHDQEADDEVAIQQTHAIAEGKPSVICGIDKDLWQVPGWHYSTNKRGFARISPQLGLRLFFRQVLSGDATDNIGGVYKLGAVKAKRLIEPGMSLADMERVCLGAYQASLDKYGHEKCGYARADDALLENVNLLWLRRRQDEWYGDHCLNEGLTSLVPAAS